MTDHKMTWKRVTKRVPCPICGVDHYCTISPDGAAVKCMRVQSSKPVPGKDGSVGWLHSLKDDGIKKFMSALKSAPQAKRLTARECESLQKRFVKSINADGVNRASDMLGISADRLRDLQIGLDSYWARGDASTGWWSFPMVDSERVIIGFELRQMKPEHAKKGSVLGSRRGIFVPLSYQPAPIPTGLAKDEAPLLLLLPEGPTDVGAAMDLGFRAVGRPSNMGGAELINGLLQRSPCAQDVVIVPDRDQTHYLPSGRPYWPGWEGALHLGRMLHYSCPKASPLRILSLKMVTEAKDLRQFFRQEHSPALLAAACVRASRVTDAWLEWAADVTEQRRKTEWRKSA